MEPSRLIILAVIATPLLILARDAFNRRRARRQVLLALAVLLAILANIAITLALGRTMPAPTASAGSQATTTLGGGRGCRRGVRVTQAQGGQVPHQELWYNSEHRSIVACGPVGPRS